MKPLYLDWNLGLGDAIICNGLVRWLARFRERLIVPAWSHNLPTVEHMFSDLENVTVSLPYSGDARPAPSRDYDVLSIGINNPRFGAVEPWDRAFYVFADVPFEAKWDLFHVPPSGSELPSVTPRGFQLVHEDQERGFCIDYSRLSPNMMRGHVMPGLRFLTDLRHVIRDATEIHCIDSSVMHLAELMPTTGKLFYHKYARALGNRNHCDATLRKAWTVYE